MNTFIKGITGRKVISSASNIIPPLSHGETPTASPRKANGQSAEEGVLFLKRHDRDHDTHQSNAARECWSRGTTLEKQPNM